MGRKERGEEIGWRSYFGNQVRRIFFFRIYKMMKLTLLASLVLLSLVAAQCPANYDIPNLVADSVLFTVPSPKANSSQTYQYNFKTALAARPSVAIAVQDFSISGLGPHAFYVTPAQVSSSSIVFSFAWTAPLWSKLRFNFWASASSQIQLGTFAIPNLSAVDNAATVTTSLQSAFSASDKPVIRAFINGYMSWGQVIQLAVAPSNLEGTTLSVKIMLGSTTNVTAVWLSYIAFSPSTTTFGAYGGAINKAAFSGSLDSDISSSLYGNSYLLYGLTQLSLTGQTALSYSSTIKDYTLSVSASRAIDSFAIMYIVAGVSPSQLCKSCGSSMVAYGNSCLSACPLGTTPKSFSDSGIACQGTAVTSSSMVGLSQQTQTSAGSSGSSTSASPANAVSTNADSLSCGGDHTFFNGYECVCEVGYGSINGVCVAISFSRPIPIVVNTYNPINATQTTTTTSTTQTTSSQVPSIPSSSSSGASSTSSSTSSSSSSTTAVKPSTVSIVCPANSYDNGLGTCVCSTGYYFDGTKCLSGAPCPSGSTRQADGSCKCDAGLTNYNGFCSRCPQGAIWSDTTKVCIFVCGQNSVYSQSVSSCVCVSGFGLMNGVCSVCPNNYFISQSYCVTCPVNSVLNPAKNTCDCQSGYYTNQFGICSKKCSTNEVYDSSSQQCSCLSGLGRINGVCTVCPSGTQVVGDSCSSCSQNEQLVNGKCICKTGYAYNSGKVCTFCSDLPNGFLINGVCSVCPSGLIYSGNYICSCPAGKIKSGSSCISQCQADELLDSQGNCFTCGNNQVISGGKCVCKTGYSLNSCGICVLACTSGQFVFQGGCAVCPLNTVFNSQIGGCSCPDGYYKDNFGVCSQVVLKAINCPAGQYFDATNGCVTCPGSCKTCLSATKCTACVTTGYAPNSAGTCVPQCGDGLIIGSETCDTGNSYSAGCINCQIQTGYTCSGQPSVCRAPTPIAAPTPVVTPAPVTPTGTGSSSSATSGASANTQGLVQSGSTTINSNNVFVTLKTNPTFTFANPTDMQNFIVTNVVSGAKPTVYCSQRPNPDLNLFDCLMIYPSGVPNVNFSVNFSYNYQGKTGAVTVTVDPFAVSNSRSNSRVGS